MRIIDNKIDLAKSFEKLKPMLELAENHFNEGRLKDAYYILYFGIKIHNIECTADANTPPLSIDDIPAHLFSQ